MAKALIDAGLHIDRFSGSTQSQSRYIHLSSGAKIRLSNHELPLNYASPDYEYQYGTDIEAFVRLVQGAECASEEANEAPGPS